jgi:hypothetical protein
LVPNEHAESKGNSFAYVNSAAYLGQSALILRRRAHLEDMPLRHAQRLLRLATVLQVLVEMVESAELDADAAQTKAVSHAS